MKKMLAMLMALVMIFSIVPAMVEGEIALSADYLELTKLGQTAYLAMMENGAEKAADSYASSNEKVAVVNHGVIMAMGDGSAVITASYAGKEYTCAVKVATDFSVVIDGDGVLNLKSGETAALSAQVNLPTIFDTVTGVIWSSTDEKVASVNADGVLTAVGPGICVIKAESQTRKTVESRSMYGTFVSTDPAQDSIVVVVDNEYDAEKYPDLLGLYTGSHDWQGFVEDLKEKYVLVKGDADSAERAKEVLFSFSGTGSYGYEGLCLAQDMEKLAGLDVTREVPTLFQISVAIMKKESKVQL